MTMPHVEHGFVIARPNGRLLDWFLYSTRAAAEFTTKVLYPDHVVKPARRVTSFRRSSTTTLTTRSEIIIDEDAE